MTVVTIASQTAHHHVPALAPESILTTPWPGKQPAYPLRGNPSHHHHHQPQPAQPHQEQQQQQQHHRHEPRSVSATCPSPQARAASPVDPKGSRPPCPGAAGPTPFPTRVPALAGHQLSRRDVALPCLRGDADLAAAVV